MAESLYSISDEYRRKELERQETIRLNLANQLQHDPEESRRILSVSAATGLPNEVVAADLPNLEKLVTQREFNIDKWRADSPHWANYISENPYHLSAMRDDQENMSTIGRAIHQIGLGFDSTKAQVEVGKIRSRQAGGIEYPEDEADLKELKKLLVEHEFGAENLFVRLLVKNAKMVGPIARSIGMGIETGLETSMVFGAAAAVAGQLGPQAALPEEFATVPAAALVGFKVGFTTGSTMSAFELERGFAYDEYLEMGVDKETARLAASSVGLVNAALEALSISRAVKYVPWLRGSRAAIGKKLTGEVLSAPSVAKASAALVGRFGEVMGTEIVTEVMQETVTTVTGDLIRKDSQGMPLTWDSYVDRMANVAVEVLQGAFIISSFGPVMSYYSDLRAAKEAERMHQVYLALGKGAKYSSTLKDLPEKYREFVKRMTEHGAIEALNIDVQRFDEYFQSKDLDPDEIANKLGIEAEDLRSARVLGGTIAMPIVEYAEMIAPTEHHGGLAADLKVGDAVSAREAEQFRANNPEIIASMEKILEPEADDSVKQELINDLTGQLVAQGYDPETAATSAHALLGIINLAERMGMDPKELYEARLKGVRGATPEGVAEDVDMDIDPILDMLRTGDIPTERAAYGPSLTEFLVESGGLSDIEKELDEMDAGKAIRGLIKEGGRSLDDAALVAAEAGFIPTADVPLLLEAIERGIAGEPVYGADFKVVPGAEEMRAALEEVGRFLFEEGIDLDELTNVEVRKFLSGITTLEQMDEDSKTEWLNLFESLVSKGENPEMLAEAVAMMPRVYAKQDLRGVSFTDTVRVGKEGEPMQVTKSAQKQFDKAVKRRNSLKRLMDCVDG